MSPNAGAKLATPSAIVSLGSEAAGPLGVRVRGAAWTRSRLVIGPPTLRGLMRAHCPCGMGEDSQCAQESTFH